MAAIFTTQGAKQKMAIGKVKRSQAVQEFLPKVDVYVTQGPHTDYFGRPVTQNNIYYSGVGLEQPLYRGGTLSKGVKLAESETSRHEQEYLYRKLAVAAAAIKAYYEALTAQAEAQLHLAAWQYQAQKKIHRVGGISLGDLQEAEARFHEKPAEVARYDAEIVTNCENTPLEMEALVTKPLECALKIS